MFDAKYFRIADLLFQILPPCDVLTEAAFIPFSVSKQEADIKVRFSAGSVLPVPDGTEVHREDCFSIYQSNESYFRIYYSSPLWTDIQALTEYDWESGEVRIVYPEKKRKIFCGINCIFGHLGFEEIMLSRNRLILHASLINTPLGGILFSGPSGIGKSTQAELWRRYEGCEILNGDRPIISSSKEDWLAWGSPYAGSSRCYVNKNAPLRAIILLRQDEKCSLRRLGAVEAFCRLYAETTVNNWNKKYVNRVCDLLSAVIRDIPVYEYGCTADQDAVRYLKQALQQEAIQT